MFVQNDATKDSRVLREASTLAAAGHQITIVARPRREAPGVAEREQHDGVTVLRIPPPTGWQIWWRWAQTPWAARKRVPMVIKEQLRLGPRGWPKIAGTAVLVLLAIPWALILAIGQAVSRVTRRTSRPAPGGGWVEWLVRWRFATLGWAAAAAAAAPPADIYHGHDMTGLPAAIRAAERTGGLVVYDSHEIFMESGVNVDRPRWARALIAGVERRWARRAAALVTVSPAIAAELERRLHPRRVVVVHNCPPRWSRPAVHQDRLRDAMGVAPETAVLLYHGAFTLHRGLEQLADAILEPGLANVHVAYLGYGWYRPQLDALVAEPRFGGRLHVIDAVPPSELLDWVTTADVEVIAGQNSTLNHFLSSPNKLFEALAAGVPVVAMDFPEIRRIVMDDPDGPLGATCDPADPRSIAMAVRSILERSSEARAQLRERCHKAANERWNWETESIRLVALYDELTSKLGGLPAQS